MRREAKPLEHLRIAVACREQEEVPAVRSAGDNEPPLGLTLFGNGHVFRENGNSGCMMRVANQVLSFRQAEETAFRESLVHGFVRLHGEGAFFVCGGS